MARKTCLLAAGIIALASYANAASVCVFRTYTPEEIPKRLQGSVKALDRMKEKGMIRDWTYGDVLIEGDVRNCTYDDGESQSQSFVIKRSPIGDRMEYTLGVPAGDDNGSMLKKTHPTLVVEIPSSSLGAKTKRAFQRTFNRTRAGRSGHYSSVLQTEGFSEKELDLKIEFTND